MLKKKKKKKKKKRNEAVAELPNSVLNINNIWKWAMKHECDKKHCNAHDVLTWDWQDICDWK